VRRGLTLLLLAAVGLAAPSMAAADDRAGTGAAGAHQSACVWKWKTKKVIKKIQRHGKVKRVVRIRKRRVCVPVQPPAPARIGVNAFEFHFILSATRIAAGDTIAELSNRGEDPHDLHIAKLDGTGEVAIPETLPSTYARVRFNTEPGTYRLWCSLPFHAERGMEATFEATTSPR